MVTIIDNSGKPKISEAQIEDAKAQAAQIQELRYYRDNEVKDLDAKELINKRILELNKEQLKLGVWDFGTNLVINSERREK